jgi:hypothetical protein
VATYKSPAAVERDFRSLKAIDLDLRPIHHYTESRVRAHVFICMLASYLVWHLRQAWAPLTFTDENRPDPLDRRLGGLQSAEPVRVTGDPDRYVSGRWSLPEPAAAAIPFIRERSARNEPHG